MSRKKAFKPPKVEQATMSDSRFGVRRMFLTKQERPRIATYRTPGKGPNGESQN